MHFSIGQRVYVIPLRKNGTIVKINSRGEYRVELESGTTWCKVEQIQVAATTEKAKPKAEHYHIPGIKIESDAIKAGAALAKLDLHGMKVVEAMRLVEEHVSRAVLANLAEVEIQHGIGSGALMKALHQLLPQIKVVKSFTVKESNRGVTRVFL
jgi:DNA mismatch repair protein MutS2